MLDIAIGQFLRATPHFKGKGRLTNWYVHRSRSGQKQIVTLKSGGRIACDLGVPYEAMVWLGYEESEDLSALSTILKPGNTFVDCGANIGLWTITASKIVGSGGKVFSAEPNPTTFAKLKHNVALSKGGDIVMLFPFALGEREGTARFACSRDHNVSHVANDAASDTIEVPIRTVDSIVNTAQVHGMKIDVEGSELSVLKGADKILARDKPWIILEFNTTELTSKRLADFLPHQFLKTYGYQATLLVPKAGESTGPLDAETFTEKGYCNLLYRCGV